MTVMSASRYFIAAAGLLLLGAVALPTGYSAYDAARHGSDAISVGLGVYGSFVLAIAFGGPVILTVAGILSLLLRHDE
jgi:hypothetical protein